MNIFDGYDWTEIKVVRVMPTNAVASEQLLVSSIKKSVYQLSVKFQGRTEVVREDNNLVFDEGSILYLPSEMTRDITYNKYIRESGTGVCIFFTSANPLPPVPTVIKMPNLPLESFTKVLNKWRQVDSYLACVGEFYSLLDKLKKAIQPPSQKGNQKQNLLVAKTYIEEHFTDKYIDIEQLSRYCGLSAEYFRQSFKQTYGVTPLRHLFNLKLAFAQKLLTETDLPVGEIARQCGFEDANYFTRTFGQHTGFSPSHYRREIGHR